MHPEYDKNEDRQSICCIINDLLTAINIHYKNRVVLRASQWYSTKQTHHDTVVDAFCLNGSIVSKLRVVITGKFGREFKYTIQETVTGESSAVYPEEGECIFTQLITIASSYTPVLNYQG